MCARPPEPLPCVARRTAADGADFPATRDDEAEAEAEAGEQRRQEEAQQLLLGELG